MFLRWDGATPKQSETVGNPAIAVHYNPDGRKDEIVDRHGSCCGGVVGNVLLMRTSLAPGTVKHYLDIKVNNAPDVLCRRGKKVLQLYRTDYQIHF